MEYTVTDAYPLPTEYACPFPFEDMTAGESFTVDIDGIEWVSARQIQSAVQSHVKRWRKEYPSSELKMVTRALKNADGEVHAVRVWRAA